MAEQRNGYVVPRKDNGELAGYAPGHWHTWIDDGLAQRYTGDMPVPCVTYIGPDAPQWRERPTCPGKYLDANMISVFDFNQSVIENFGPHLSIYIGRGPWLGPLPAIPEELK